MKQLLGIVSTLVVAAIVCTLCIGWILAHPVQMRVTDPPVDLNAQPVDFESGSRSYEMRCLVERRGRKLTGGETASDRTKTAGHNGGSKKID
jgi:hypothetical protein